MTKQEYLDEVLKELKRLEVNGISAEGEIKPKGLLNKGGMMVKLYDSITYTTANIENVFNDNCKPMDVAYTLALQFEEAAKRTQMALNYAEYQKQLKEGKIQPPAKHSIQINPNATPEERAKERKEILNNLIAQTNQLKQMSNGQSISANDIRGKSI